MKSSIEESMRVYSEKWKLSAAFNEKENYYKWMNSFIKQGSRILEIGCGTGESTFSLSKNCDYIVVLEENTECLLKAKNYLLDKNVEVINYKRLIKVQNKVSKYKKKYSEMKNERIKSKVTLIESDVVHDFNINNWLSCQPKFDYIICWLLGTHSLKLHKDLRANPSCTVGPDGRWTEEDYRWMVLLEVISKFGEVLTKDGKIHIVDREFMPQTEEQFESDICDYERLLNIPRGKMSFEYHDFKFEDGINYINTNTDEKLNRNEKLALISIMVENNLIYD